MIDNLIFTYPDTFKKGSFNASNNNDVHSISLRPSQANNIIISRNANDLLGNSSDDCSSVFMCPVYEEEFLTVGGVSCMANKAEGYDE